METVKRSGRTITVGFGVIFEIDVIYFEDESYLLCGHFVCVSLDVINSFSRGINELLKDFYY